MFKGMKDNRGFTLVELLVVVAILAIIGAIIVPNIFKAAEKGKVSAAIADYNAIKTAVMSYYFDNGEWPANGGALVSDYLDKWPVNPWGGDYEISEESDAIELTIKSVPLDSAKQIDVKLDGTESSSDGIVTYDSSIEPIDVSITISK